MDNTSQTTSQSPVVSQSNTAQTLTPNPVNVSPQSSSNYDNFDPTKDIDLSNIEIIDTSKGGNIDFSQVAPTTRIYSFRCLNCGFRYEGKDDLQTCPRCGSDKIDDSV